MELEKQFTRTVKQALLHANVDLAKAEQLFVENAPAEFKKAIAAGKKDSDDASFGFKTKKPTQLQITAFTIGFTHSACMFAKDIISQLNTNTNG